MINMKSSIFAKNIFMKSISINVHKMLDLSVILVFKYDKDKKISF
jgi:hypothetical protein